jgi:hypothetical protein
LKLKDPKEIITVHSSKKIFFAVTQEGDVLISNEDGHIEIYNLKGHFRQVLPLMPMRLRVQYERQRGDMPKGADFISIGMSEEQRMLWIGCQNSLLICFDYLYVYLGSLEVPGYEFTACCPSSAKRNYAIYGASDGSLMNVRLNKEFEQLEVRYKKEAPFLTPAT